MPERPYLPPGSLRAALGLPPSDAAGSPAEIASELASLDLEPVVTRAGGLDREADWDNLLSLGEQQLLCIARILLAPPRFALLHEIGTTLDPAQVSSVLALLSKRAIATVLLAQTPPPEAAFDAVFEIDLDGGWRRR